MLCPSVFRNHNETSNEAEETGKAPNSAKTLREMLDETIQNSEKQHFRILPICPHKLIFRHVCFDFSHLLSSPGETSLVQKRSG